MQPNKSHRRNLFIVGLMAVGKSTVGRLLAQQLDMGFFDTDHVIEERAGADVAWIFDVEGEAGFRDREQQVVAELTGLDGVVLATGGGVVLRPENRTMLATRGVVIHLDSSLERLIERTRRDRKRPLLRDGDAAETLARLKAERAPLYREIADYHFETDNQGPKAMARAIEKALADDGLI